MDANTQSVLVFIKTEGSKKIIIMYHEKKTVITHIDMYYLLHSK